MAKDPILHVFYIEALGLFSHQWHALVSFSGCLICPRPSVEPRITLNHQQCLQFLHQETQAGLTVSALLLVMLICGFVRLDWWGNHQVTVACAQPEEIVQTDYWENSVSADAQNHWKVRNGEVLAIAKSCFSMTFHNSSNITICSMTGIEGLSLPKRTDHWRHHLW